MRLLYFPSRGELGFVPATVLVLPSFGAGLSPLRKPLAYLLTYFDVPLLDLTGRSLTSNFSVPFLEIRPSLDSALLERSLFWATRALGGGGCVAGGGDAEGGGGAAGGVS